jgi:hypothetical protein
MDDATLARVLPALSRCTALTHLNLAGNQLSDAGLGQLAVALGVRVSITFGLQVDCAQQ